jgi:hypothetical protein
MGGPAQEAPSHASRCAPSILGPTPTGASYLINNVVRRVHAFGRACILAYTLTSRTSRHAWTVAHAY